MKRTTGITLVLVLFTTWVSTLALVVPARAIMPFTIDYFESFASSIPPPTLLFMPFWLSTHVYWVPALASILLILLEIFVRSERSRLVVHVVYTSVWLLFVTLNFVVLLLPEVKMSGTVGG
jgi:hypothetical protein